MWSKTFVFSQVINSVDFVYQFDEAELGVRAWFDNEVRVTIEGKDSQECQEKMDAVDKIGDAAGGGGKDGANGKWRRTDR